MNSMTKTMTAPTTTTRAVHSMSLSGGIRLMTGTAAAAVTFCLFQAVALYGKPPVAEAMAWAEPAVAVAVALAR